MCFIELSMSRTHTQLHPRLAEWVPVKTLSTGKQTTLIHGSQFSKFIKVVINLTQCYCSLNGTVTLAPTDLSVTQFTQTFTVATKTSPQYELFDGTFTVNVLD